MPVNITMPALSPTMEEGRLAKWLVREGEAVSSGDPLVEIETDKATMEVEAVDEGVMGKLLVAEGTDGVKVNEVIAVLLKEGEGASAITVAPTSRPVAETPPPAAAAPGGRRPASPLARRIAAMKGIDLASVTGSGPHGRIVKRDVEAAVESTGDVAAPAAGPTDDAATDMFGKDAYVIEPHDGMRRIIAERLTESKRTIPHFYLSADVELDALLALRGDVNAGAPAGADGQPEYRVSVNDFVIKAMGAALRRIPDANVTWTADGMLKHSVCDVGVAVAVPGGLLTPVVRDADTKGLAEISREMKDLAARARARKLLPEDYRGGATAVSNLGMFGVRDFSAVINPPHATILAVGAAARRPVVSGDEIRIATVMTVTLSTDHRAVDGALGARFLTAIRNNLEHPAMMLV